MSDGMTEANKDQAEYEAEQEYKLGIGEMTEFPEEQRDYETRQLIAQTVEQTLAKLREQEHAQKHANDLAEVESKFAAISDTLGNARTEVTELLKLFAGDNANRLNGVSVSVGDHVTTVNWYIDKEYGWAYTPVTRPALENAMDKCITKANEKRAQEPPATLSDELDDEILF